MRVGIGIGLLVMLAGGAQAATVMRLDLAQRVDRAQRIAVGRVESQEAFRDGGRLLTRVTLKVEHILKGPAAEIILFEVLGGVVDGVGQRVAGAPRFAVGDRAVLFLAPAGKRGALRVVGMGQGRLRIVERPGGAVVQLDHDGLRLVEPEPGPGPLADTRLPVELPLAELLRRVRALLPGAPAAGPGTRP